MATGTWLWGFIPLLFLVGRVVDDRAAVNSKLRLQQIYQSELGIREATGNNDGSRVAEYLAYCGLPEGYEWCAAFVSWCYGQAGYAEPKNAWAAALFPQARVVWRPSGQKPVASDRPSPIAGDVFGLYIPSKKRIAHCGFVDSWDGNWCLTVEGNVDNAVVRKRRPIQTIHAVARWLPHNP